MKKAQAKKKWIFIDEFYVSIWPPAGHRDVSDLLKYNTKSTKKSAGKKTLVYWQRVCYLFAVCCPITVWFLLFSGWTPAFSLLAHRRSPLICSMLTTCHWLLLAGSSWPNFRFFLFSTRRWTNRRALLVVSSQRFAARHTLLRTCFLVAQCRLLTILYNTYLLMFPARDWPLKPCF